ncbi:MAG TPA: integrase arm-type DNA-binding domain-containing protein [Lysobacter sp.]
MAANTGTLTAVTIRNAKPSDKTQRLFDGGGLYLEVAPNGSRYWRMKYRHAGKEKRIAFGVYPEVSLSEARVKRDAARAAIREGRDPSAERRANKLRAVLSAETTFEAIGREWLAAQKRKLAASTFAKSEWMLGDNVFPWLGSRPIAEIDAPELLAILRRIEARGAHETAHRTKEKCGQVFRYAIATGRASRDPSADLRGALAPIVRTSRAAVTDPGLMGDLLRAIDGYTGQFATRCALRLAPLLFVRPGELRHAEWREMDLDAAVWRIPAHKMKMRETHTVPLSPQALAILRELEPLTGRGRYLFPSLRTPAEPMSENTVNAALRRLGYDKDTMTGHGFRAMASTRLNEMGWTPDVIERQLAHAERNKVRAAYNRAQYLAERKKMMAAWADYLDQLRADTGKFKRKT